MSDQCQRCEKPKTGRVLADCAAGPDQDCHYCHGHADKQPQPAEASDLTALIERYQRMANPHPNDAERDEIVLALRVLRVLRHDGCYGSRNSIQEMKFDVHTGEGYQSGRSLDAAERLLGIGGGE